MLCYVMLAANVLGYGVPNKESLRLVFSMRRAESVASTDGGAAKDKEAYGGFGLPFAVLIVSLWASINLALNFVRSPTPQALPFCCLACVVARAVQFRRFEGAGERRVGLQLPVVLLWLSHDRLIHWRERHFPDQT